MNYKPPKRILVLAEHFAPAYKAGGIVQSLENLVKTFGSKYEFRVITSNHNLDKNEKLADILYNHWISFAEKCKVMYLSSGYRKLFRITQIIKTTNPDIVYINGMFSPCFTLLPILFIRTFHKRTTTVLAPRGMLHVGNLKSKSLKKKIFLFFFKLSNLHKKIRWHATDPQEQNDILKMFGRNAEVALAPPIPNTTIPFLTTIRKNSGELKLATVSLITEKKGHLTLLKSLREASPKLSLELHLYGPVKDRIIWESCKREIKSLNENITVTYHGFIHPKDVSASLLQCHFFILLSNGENFCHAAYEALKIGRPLIISDQTPWQNLAKQKAGWNISLRNKNVLLNVLNQAHSMNQCTYNNYCKGAQNVAKRFLKKSHFKQRYDYLFS